MKKIVLVIALFFFCNFADAQRVKMLTDFPLINSNFILSDGLSFSVNGYGYTGFFFITDSNEFWKYTPSGDSWTRIPFPYKTVSNIYAAGGFSINSTIYIVGGFGDTAINAVYAYNTLTNTWSKKNKIPGQAVGSYVGFSLNNKGYIALGEYYVGTTTYSVKTLYEYDPVSDVWTKKADFPGVSRAGAFAYIKNNKAYIGHGYDGNTFYSDLWQYDPTSNTWTLINNSCGMALNGSSAFVINNNVYRAFGTNQWGDILNIIQQQDTVIYGFIIGGTDTLPASNGLAFQSCFVLNNKAYFTGGFYDAFMSSNPHVYVFSPLFSTGISESNVFQESISIYPNPVSALLNIHSTFQKNGSIEIRDFTGKRVFSDNIFSNQVDVSHFKPGLYFIKIVTPKGIQQAKFVKE